MDVETADPEHEKKISQLAEMGYERDVCEKALKETKSVEAACEWLMNNGDAADASRAPQTAKSIKCVETGKLFRTMADAMIYAERTGHANFEETDVEIPPLTPEEKAERVQKAKALMKAKLAERQEQDKKDELERERARRAGGREMGQIREEQQMMQRQRDAEAREREKKRFAQEAKKLHEAVARDKAERAMEKAERLGLGNPKEAYDKAYAAAMGTNDPTQKSPVERADASLKVIDAFRVGNKGLECCKTLNKLLSNIVANPEEAKYRKINLKNEAIKNRIVSIQGGLAVLKAAGFEEESNGEDRFLVLPQGADLERVSQVLERVALQEKKF